MEVKLLTSVTSIKDMEQFAAIAALTCHANADKEFVASDVLKRIIKWKHDSILEHINLTYSVKSLSRACLQELARHRHLTLSVESTRHTLKQQLQRRTIVISLPDDIDVELKRIINSYLQGLFDYVNEHPDVPNDRLKYAMPECFCTNLIMTVNVRELRHILALRTAPAALKEFRDLAHALFDAVPEEYRYLLADCVHKEATVNENAIHTLEYNPERDRMERMKEAAPKLYKLVKEELIPTSDYGGIVSFAREDRIRKVLDFIDGEETSA